MVTIHTTAGYIPPAGPDRANDCHQKKVTEMKPPLPASRRRFLEFLVGVAVVHVVAIVLFYALQIERAPVARQRLFAWVWMGATVTVVVIGLQRVKRARRLGRAARR
jgi:hypothetical protein